MSHQVNDSWFERARVVSDYFESELPARLIEAALQRGDMEALAKHVQEGEAEMQMQEQTFDPIQPHDIILLGNKLFNKAIDQTDVF